MNTGGEPEAKKQPSSQQEAKEQQVKPQDSNTANDQSKVVPFTRSSDMSLDQNNKKSSKRHSKLSNNNRQSRTMSSGNERGPRERNSNGRISIPFVQEEEKPLAIVKETSKDMKVVVDELEPEIAKNVADTPVKLPASIHNDAVLEIEQVADPAQL